MEYVNAEIVAVYPYKDNYDNGCVAFDLRTENGDEGTAYQVTKPADERGAKRLAYTKDLLKSWGYEWPEGYYKLDEMKGKTVRVKVDEKVSQRGNPYKKFYIAIDRSSSSNEKVDWADCAPGELDEAPF